MPTNRRSLMKAGGLALAATLAAPSVQAGEPARHARGLATGLTLLQVQRDGRAWLAVKLEKGIVVVADAARLLGMQAPETMDQLLQDEDGPRLNAVVKAVLASSRASALYLKAAPDYAPAVSRPGKIVCVGFNYLEHLNETGATLPKVPVLFCKYNNTINRHGGTIKLPTKVATKFDYEVELVIAMGKRATDVSEADALSYVAGYATGNDFTARDLQFETGGQFTTGKSLDQFAPLGPYLVTADQVDPTNLTIECRVNGETRQSSNTNKMLFNCRQLISYISRHITLEPGDIIFTGTPEGVIYGMPKEKQKWLVAGDKCTPSWRPGLSWGLHRVSALGIFPIYIVR